MTRYKFVSTIFLLPDRCDNGSCSIVNVDFPDVINVRNQLISNHEREKNVACDLKDYSWMNEVDGSNGVVFFAAGVFHYFKREEVKSLVLELSKRYEKGCLIFDSVGKLGLKLMMSKILKNMGIKDVEGLFYVNNTIKELNWSDKIKVTSKGYMLGYYSATGALYSFSNQLKECYERLEGEAKYALLLENDLIFTVTMGSSGHATVKGKFQERPDINNVLSFEMDTDQSCFLSVISGIESLKDKYGDMQGVK